MPGCSRRPAAIVARVGRAVACSEVDIRRAEQLRATHIYVTWPLPSSVQAVAQSELCLDVAKVRGQNFLCGAPSQSRDRQSHELAAAVRTHRRMAMLAAAAAMLAAAAGLHHEPPDLGRFENMMHDPEQMRQLVPPEIMERVGGAPEWAGQSEEERTARLRRHLASEGARHDRRLQWKWEDSDEQDREQSLANATSTQAVGCSDPLANNVGQATACVYDCESLRQEYFPDEPAARCFLYDPSTQSWPAELLGLRRQRLETQTFVGLADGTNPAGDL
eukprot:COSAG04_NODE_8740_length_936_cov_1.164875_1_plen_275_part_01